MRSWLAIVVTLSGCSDPVLERLSDIKSKVCACKTASCADHEMAQVPQDELRSTPHTQQLAIGMLDCAAKLREAERPTTDPDTEGDPAGSGNAAPSGSANEPGGAAASPAAPAIPPPTRSP